MSTLRNGIIISLVITTALFVGSISVQAQTSEDAELDINVSTAGVDELNSIITSLQQRVNKLSQQLSQMRSDIEDAQVTSSTETEVSAEVRFRSQLDPGDRGEAVRRLQEWLANSEDIYPEGLVTGYYGPLTSQAVSRFQRQVGLPSVGRVGPRTLSRVNELLTDGAGQSGMVPPGLLKAPGIQRFLDDEDATSSDDEIEDEDDDADEDDESDDENEDEKDDADDDEADEDEDNEGREVVLSETHHNGAYELVAELSYEGDQEWEYEVESNVPNPCYDLSVTFDGESLITASLTSAAEVCQTVVDEVEAEGVITADEDTEFELTVKEEEANSQSSLTDYRWVWQRTELDSGVSSNDTSPDDADEFTLDFNADEETVAITTDCNDGGADYQAGEEKLSIGAIRATKRFCRRDSQEEEFFDWFSSATNYETEGADLRIFIDGGVMQFTAE